MLKEVLIVLCLMLAIAAAAENVKNDEPVQIESNESISSEGDLNSAESRYGGWLGGGRGFGHYGGFGHAFSGLGSFGGHGGFRGFGHGFRHFG